MVLVPPTQQLILISRRVAAPVTPISVRERKALLSPDSAQARLEDQFDLVAAQDPDMLELYFGEGQNDPERILSSNRLVSFLLRMSEGSELK